MSELDLGKLILHFAQCNKSEAKSQRTVSWYSEMLTEFTKYLAGSGREKVLREFSVTSVREFIISQQGKGLSPYTVQGRVRALKAFSSWLFREGYTEENILTKVKLPKAPIKVIEPLTSSEIDKLINSQNQLTAIGSRDIALLITFLDTGLRLSELSNLPLNDAHVEQGYLKVVGKGNKERVVPLGGLSQRILYRYLFHFRPEPFPLADNYLFLTLEGRHLTPNAVRLILTRWGKKAGVPRLHAHLCRHSYATSFLNQRCGDVFRLQQILGHTSLEMVRRYVHYASAQDMMQGHVSSPVDRLGIRQLKGHKIDHVLKERQSRTTN
ncbi:MAG: tyrosine-type recombinase/integrase [Chloroflexi bacterium]|nr:tyrosine-type recombinase/integrase [Chloroflexota bacterium]